MNEHYSSTDTSATRKRFDDWSGRYDSWRSRQFFNRLYRAVFSRIDPCRARDILDVGCGTGGLALLVSDLCASSRVTGVDLSPGMIAIAGGKAATRANIDFKVAAAGELPFGDGAFDLVISTLSFHHWADPRAGAAECSRVLAAGGELAIADIVSDSWAAPLYQVFGPLRGLVRRSHYSSSGFIAERFREVSFDDVRQERMWPGIVLTRGVRK